MRIIILILMLVLMVVSVMIYPDTYIKRRNHTDSYYYGGLVRPAEDYISETWIGKERLVLITANRIIFIDKKNNRGFIINKRNKTYVESVLPLELPKIVTRDLASFLPGVQYTGTVKVKAETKQVGTYKCRGCDVNSYVLYEESRQNERDSTYWAALNVPFDLKLYTALNAELLRLGNYSEKLVNEFAKIGGYPVLVESYFYPKGFAVKSTSEVVEMSEKAPPAGIYSVPAGYTKNEELTMQDLRNR